VKRFFLDFPVLVPLLAVIITEFLKLIITFFKTGKIHWKDFFSTGGIPSGHSSFVSALAICALIKKGIGSFEFTIAAVFGFLVIFDSVKLRQEAGKHATLLNKIFKNKILNERLGHSFFEVLTGIFLGSGIAFLLLSF